MAVPAEASASRQLAFLERAHEAERLKPCAGSTLTRRPCRTSWPRHLQLRILPAMHEGAWYQKSLVARLSDRFLARWWCRRWARLQCRLGRWPLRQFSRTANDPAHFRIGPPSSFQQPLRILVEYFDLGHMRPFPEFVVQRLPVELLRQVLTNTPSFPNLGRRASG